MAGRRAGMDVGSCLGGLRLPFNDLLFKAQSIHRQHFDPNRVQLSKLLNIKTGGCPEDCGYCSQSCITRPVGGFQADGCRKDRRRGAQGESGGREPLLHGCGVAQSEAEGHGRHRARSWAP